MTTPAGFEELHRLAGEAARFARIFSVEQDAETVFTGHDGTESVAVSVTADGQVTDVELTWEGGSETWAQMHAVNLEAGFQLARQKG